MTLPGFSAESALRGVEGAYRAASVRPAGATGEAIVPQMRLALWDNPWGPFSGSCGCGPGYCCCIFCYFFECYFWCWSTVEVGFGRG